MGVVLADVRQISIHAPREGSDLLGYSDERDHTISIHAPREGSDDGLYRLLEGLRIISIHAPREGSDLHRGDD